MACLVFYIYYLILLTVPNEKSYYPIFTLKPCLREVMNYPRTNLVSDEAAYASSVGMTVLK